MPWEGVTVSEQRRNFIRDYVDGLYSRIELAQLVLAVVETEICPVLGSTVTPLTAFSTLFDSIDVNNAIRNVSGTTTTATIVISLAAFAR